MLSKLDNNRKGWLKWYRGRGERGRIMLVPYPVLNIDRVNFLNSNPFLDPKEFNHMRVDLISDLNETGSDWLEVK